MSKITLLLCTIARPALASALEARPPLEVNGTRYPYEYDVPVELPEHVVEVARNAGLTVHVLAGLNAAAPADAAEESVSPAAEGGNGDAAGGDTPGGNPAGSESSDPAPNTSEQPSFDPEAIILGNVGDVAERLAGLTAAQLDLVAKAELDREQPRKGVAEAIKAAQDLIAAPPEATK